MANQERAKKGLDNPVVHDTEAPIRTAVEALRILIRKEEINAMGTPHNEAEKERLQNEVLMPGRCTSCKIYCGTFLKDAVCFNTREKYARIHGNL